MQAREERVLDNPHVVDTFAEHELERRADCVGHGGYASGFHGTRTFMRQEPNS